MPPNYCRYLIFCRYLRYLPSDLAWSVVLTNTLKTRLIVGSSAPFAFCSVFCILCTKVMSVHSYTLYGDTAVLLVPAAVVSFIWRWSDSCEAPTVGLASHLELVEYKLYNLLLHRWLASTSTCLFAFSMQHIVVLPCLTWFRSRQSQR